MSNTAFLIPPLSYANTFGDWVVATNNLIVENNNFGFNSFVKPTGTLILNDPTLGIQVGNNATIGGSFRSTGAGSSATIDNNLQVGGQAYFTNTVLGITNSGQMNVGGVLLAIGSNTGLVVSNTANISVLNVGTNANIGNILTVANNATFGNNISVVHTIISGNVTANSTLSGTNASVPGIATLGTILGTTATMTGNTVTSSLQANTAIYTANLSISGSGYINNLTANVIVANSISSNSTFGAASIVLTGSLIANTITANASINAASINVTGTTTTNTLVATSFSVTGNTTITNISNIQANGGVNTSTMSVVGSAYVNTLQANTSVNTATLSVTGNTYLNNISANGAIVANNMVTTGLATLTTANVVNLNSSGPALFNNTVTIANNIIYYPNTLTLNYNTSIPASSFINMYRGGGANTTVYMGWNEVLKYWGVFDLVTNQFQRIMTAANLTNSLALTTPAGDTYIASASAAAALNTNIANTTAYAQAAFAKANTGGNFSGNVIVSGTTTLGGGLNTPLPIASGGTNTNATPTAGGVVYGNGGAYGITPAGISGQIFTSAGAGIPTWTSATASATGGSNFNVIFTNALWIQGTSSSAKLASQDGSGRTSWSWNSSGGGSPTTLLIDEDSAKLSLQVTNNGNGGSFNFYSADTHTAIAGSPINFTQVLYADLNNFQFKGSQVLYAGNIGTYAPSLTGIGASGTWGINITGTAGSANSLNSSTSYTVGGLQIGGGGTGYTELFGGTAGNSGYIAFFDLNGNRQGYIGYAATIGGTDTGTIIMAGNYSGITTLSAGTLNAPVINSTNLTATNIYGTYQGGLTFAQVTNGLGYTPPQPANGIGASGTWGINISGTSTSATSATTANALNPSNNYTVNSLLSTNIQAAWGVGNPANQVGAGNITWGTNSVLIGCTIVSSQQIKVTVAGTYYISAAAYATASGGAQITMYHNGNPTPYNAALSASNSMLTVTGILQLNINDTVEIYANSGGIVGTYGSFTGFRIGA